MAHTEIIARALIEKDGKVLLCHGKGKENWFFPGGHIEECESAPTALLRELDEELGAFGQVVQFLGASENKFEIDGKVTHEINLLFEVVLDEGSSHESKEDHIEFAWFTYSELREMKVFPLSLRDAVLAIHTSSSRQNDLRDTMPQNRKPLWTSEGFKDE